MTLFFATVYVDDYLLIREQHSDDDRALIASASLASDHVRLFGPGEDGVTPILAPEEYRLGQHDRRPRFHHQLEHLENFVHAREDRRD